MTVPAEGRTPGPQRGLRPQVSLALGFLSVILIGAALLLLPCASASGRGLSLVDALFTACSAVCVTGLTVIDVGRELSLFGQSVLLVLVELGGLGVMTLGTFLLVVVGRRLSVANEFSLMDAYGVEEVQGLRGLVVWVVSSMLFFEAAGAVIIWARFTCDAPSLVVALQDGHAWFRACFYAVMGFCNAGFGLRSDNLISFRGDPVFISTIGALCVVGGLGFLVIINLCSYKFWRRNRLTRGRLTLHTRVVLAVTSVMLFGGAALFMLLETRGTLAELCGWEQITCSFIQTVTAHTAGFTVIPLDQAGPATRLLTEVLMMIGGSPGSAAGGIKTTTVAVLLCTVWAMCRGRTETTIYNRTVPMSIVRESIVIFVFAMMAVMLVVGVLLLTEEGRPGLDPERLLFEAVSALSTTGLSLGATPLLSIPGKAVIMLCMFVGRLGALTVVLLIGNREEKQRIRYPNEELVVG